MRRSNPFGSHLYSQIVAPLLAALLAVGLLATAVAVYFLRDLTGDWVEQQTQSATANVVSRHEEFTRQMQRITAFASHDADLLSAIDSKDPEAIRQSLLRARTLLGFDQLMLLDADARLVVGDGTPGTEAGERPFGRLKGVIGPKFVFERLGDRFVLAAMHPVMTGDKTYVLVSVHYCDDMLLTSLGGGDSMAFGMYTGNWETIARSVGGDFAGEERRALIEALSTPSESVAELLDGGRGEQSAGGVFKVGEYDYQAWVMPLRVPGEGGEDASAYLMGVVSQAVSQTAGATTTNLIMMWSVAAILGLVGLGGWVARRVSDPLVALSDGAQRVAEGDYTAKFEVHGTNEVAQLAETFNLMTDSLKDRSDSLTKKVLELATLYEMSRSLGSTLELDELFASVLSSALRIFDLDSGYIALRDKDTGELSVRATAGPVNVDDLAAVQSSMSDWVSREGRPLIFNPDPSMEGEQVDAVTGARAALCVPLTSSEGTIGSITVGSSRPEYRFSSDDVRLLSTIANHVTIAVGNIELFSSLQEAYLATVRSLAAAVDAKDRYTRGHSDRVALYAVMIADQLGLSPEHKTALEMAAYLHDIGKIGVREEILLKPGVLTEVEMSQMRHHPLIGANILQPVAFPWAITPIVRHHHEYYDGTGYPAGLKGDEIPLLARILTVADSFEAMTSDRPYRAGRTTDEAIEELLRCAGTQFDPGIVEVFVEVLQQMREAGDPVESARTHDVSPEEARAVFSALVEGLLMSFKQLGGARLGSNVEGELDEFFVNSEMPFRIDHGRIEFLAETPASLDGELEQMRTGLRRLELIMGRLSGTTLVDHFYVAAADSLSVRMREISGLLSFADAD